jgi:uncharacterized membrane protein
MRAGRWCFVVLLAVGTGFVAVSLSRLPSPMAIHFGANGRADNWASRGTYVAVLALLGVVLPLVQVTLVPRLAATRPELLNLPGRDYWLAPARRAGGIQRLRTQMWWFACLLLAMALALHGLTLAAHASVPPRLPIGGFVALLVGFLLGTLAWVASVTAAMRPPRDGDTTDHR